ncbi:MAG: histidine phosphatase family protein [Roseovarius sp.]
MASPIDCRDPTGQSRGKRTAGKSTPTFSGTYHNCCDCWNLRLAGGPDGHGDHGIPAPVHATEYARYLPQVMGHWARGDLDDVPESFEHFTTRITGLLDEIAHLQGRTLVVTSGGVIGLVMRHALGLDISGMSKVMLQVMNSSLHRMEHVHDMLMLGTFNATPHLDLPDRAHARTFI